MTALLELPSLSYQEGRLLMDERSRVRGIPSSRTITSVFGVSGPFSVAAFQQSLATVVGRHQALRTSFPGDPSRQVVRAVVEVPVEVIEPAGHEAVPSIAAAQQRTQFAPADCPRLRATVLRLTPDRHVVILVFDHLVMDAWSRALVLDEIAACYAGHDLPALDYTYSEYVLERHAALVGPERRRLLDFWTRTLAGAGAIPALTLPHPRTGGEVGGASLARRIPAQLADRLRTAARHERATLFMLLLAAVQLSLARLSGEPDQSIATNIYNRDTMGTEQLVAPMSDMMVVRTDLTGAGTLTEALRRVRESSLDAQEHALLPYGELVKALNPNQYADPDAPIGVVFNMLYPDAARHGLDLPGATCTPMTVPAIGTRRLRSELVIGADVGPTGTALSGHYQTDRLSAAVVDSVLDAILELLTTAGTP